MVTYSCDNGIDGAVTQQTEYCYHRAIYMQVPSTPHIGRF